MLWCWTLLSVVPHCLSNALNSKGMTHWLICTFGQQCETWKDLCSPGHFQMVRKLQMARKKVAAKHCGHNIEMTDILKMYTKTLFKNIDMDVNDDEWWWGWLWWWWLRMTLRILVGVCVTLVCSREAIHNWKQWWEWRRQWWCWWIMMMMMTRILVRVCITFVGSEKANHGDDYGDDYDDDQEWWLW